MGEQIRIVAVGGTSSPGSSTEKALRIASSAVAVAGAHVTFFDGAFLTSLPHYQRVAISDCSSAQEFISSIREASGVLIASPGWHGSVSGLVKNALDYLEETARDERAYLDGVPVGLIVTAYGWQATGSTLSALRTITHSLRGWPTPMGAGVNCSGGIFRGDVCLDDAALRQLHTVGRQVLEFARMRQSHKDALRGGSPPAIVAREC